MALREAERPRLRTLLLRAFLKAWVPTANGCLYILKRIFFGNRRPAPNEIHSILAYTVGIVGDNVVMLPALAALRKNYPRARITVVTNCHQWGQSGAVGVLGPSNFKDRLIVLDADPVIRHGLNFSLDSRLKGLSCELFVNFSPFGNRGWLGAVLREMIFARKAGARHAVGFRMSTLNRKGLFNQVQHDFIKNEPRRPAMILSELGLPSAGEGDFLTLDPDGKERMLDLLSLIRKPGAPLFVLNPGAKFSSQRWPPDRFGAIAKLIAERFDGTVVVTGTQDEQTIAEEVVRISAGIAVNLAGRTTLQELVELLRLAKGCVTNDTGTMHLAAMLRTPTVAIFSLRHSPAHWLPIGGNVLSLFALPECRYCFDDYCEQRNCLKAIEVEHVQRALDTVLNSDGRKAGWPDSGRTCHGQA